MNKIVLDFSFTFLNDGTSTSVSINLSTQPISPVQIVNSINLATAIGATALSCDSGASVTSSSLLLGILTVNLSSAGIAGTTNVIYGLLEF